jgi:membrane peptidoglycan carboxypeptidase
MAVRDLERSRPRRFPVFRVALVLFLAAVIGLVSMGGVAAMVGANVVGSLVGGLPDPTDLTKLDFAQPTVIYDRTGTVELARFERENRRVVTYDDVPKLLLDATTAAEDRTFWQNDGFDPAAIVAAAYQNATGDNTQIERGASTITQQLVRARLLPPDVAQSNDRYLRKVMELLQASRVTSAFPGEQGKEQIITAYLNQIYYGHQAFGIAAAAQIYFGVSDLNKLTLAQAALLAGLPKAPSTYDPYKYAVKDDQGRLVVPMDAPPVTRRAYVLNGMSTARWTKVTQAQITAALAEPVVLAGTQPSKMRALLVGGAGPAPGDPGQRGRAGDRRLQGHHDARLGRAAAGREVRLRRGDHPEPPGATGGQGDGPAEAQSLRPTLGQSASRQGPAQRRARRARLPDR